MFPNDDEVGVKRDVNVSKSALMLFDGLHPHYNGDFHTRLHSTDTNMNTIEIQIQIQWMYKYKYSGYTNTNTVEIQFGNFML